MTAVTVAPLVGVETVTVQAALALPRNRKKKMWFFDIETGGGGGGGAEQLTVKFWKKFKFLFKFKI